MFPFSSFPTLHPSQLVGINWLMQLYRQNVGGAIMADEMGLGKTAQVRPAKPATMLGLQGGGTMLTWRWPGACRLMSHLQSFAFAVVYNES